MSIIFFPQHIYTYTHIACSFVACDMAWQVSRSSHQRECIRRIYWHCEGKKEIYNIAHDVIAKDKFLCDVERIEGMLGGIIVWWACSMIQSCSNPPKCSPELCYTWGPKNVSCEISFLNVSSIRKESTSLGGDHRDIKKITSNKLSQCKRKRGKKT